MGKESRRSRLRNARAAPLPLLLRRGVSADIADAEPAAGLFRRDDAQLREVQEKLGLARFLDAAIRALLHDDEGRAEKDSGEQAQGGADGNVGLVR